MSISPVVDANYRLQPADLEGAARQVVISNVTYQGVEKMTPVLHFAGQTKRLVLSPEQAREVLAITGTPLFPQWIGAALILQPLTANGESRIEIRAPGRKKRASAMPIYISEERRGWYLALSVVGILLCASLLYAALDFATILTTLQELRDNWPLR